MADMGSSALQCALMKVGQANMGIRADHLLPEESPLFGAPFIPRYFLRVAETLFESGKIKRAEGATAVCLPSFEAEWAVRLIGSEKVPYSVLLVEAKEQIW